MEQWLPAAEGGETGSSAFNGFGVSGWDDNFAVKMDSGDGCTRSYFVPLNCMLKNG